MLLRKLLEAMSSEGVGTVTTSGSLYKIIRHKNDYDAPDGIFIRYTGVTVTLSAWKKHDQDLWEADRGQRASVKFAFLRTIVSCPYC